MIFLYQSNIDWFYVMNWSVIKAYPVRFEYPKIWYFQVINPEASNVKLLGTKVEINLRKAEPGKWSALEVPQCIKKEEEADGDINTDGVDAL